MLETTTEHCDGGLYPPSGLGPEGGPTSYEIMAQASLRHLERMERQDGWVMQSAYRFLTEVLEDQGCNSWADLKIFNRKWLSGHGMWHLQTTG
jgi:hypothetical protein